MLLLAMLVIVRSVQAASACKSGLVGGALENALAKTPRAPCAPAQARGACDPCGTKLNEPIALRLARGDAVDHAA